MKQVKGMVVLVTENNPQTNLFVDQIERQLGCSVNVVSPNEKIDLRSDQLTVVVLDIDHVDEELMHRWAIQYSDCNSWVIAAFNVKNEERAIDLLHYIHLQGVFYRSDTFEIICKGVEQLLHDGFWLSRPLMMSLIEHFRKQQLNYFRPGCGLTHREMEIAGLLATGISNSGIADQLFVSEHTVKSHLYNIFRKLNVQNRTQAAAWARDNLAPPIPPRHPRHARHSLK